MVSPGHKRQIAQSMVDRGRYTAREACRHFGLHRSTFGYAAKEPDAWMAKLKTALRRLSRLYPEWGYKKITQLLKKEGWSVGARMIQQLRRQLGLMSPKSKPKQRRQGVSTGLPTKATHPNHVWTWDFVHYTTTRGGKLRMLTVVDEYTHRCLRIHVDRRINARKVRQIMSHLIAEHGAPGHIRSDNGSEFIEKELRAWLASHKIKTIYIDPGSPWQNGFIESFNARLRHECLNREQLFTLTEARVVIEDWRWKYNHIRPHGSLGYISPVEFEQELLAEELKTGMGSSRPAASLRPSLDLLYSLHQYINPARLTL